MSCEDGVHDVDGVAVGIEEGDAKKAEDKVSLHTLFVFFGSSDVLGALFDGKLGLDEFAGFEVSEAIFEKLEGFVAVDIADHGQYEVLGGADLSVVLYDLLALEGGDAFDGADGREAIRVCVVECAVKELEGFVSELIFGCADIFEGEAAFAFDFFFREDRIEQTIGEEVEAAIKVFAQEGSAQADGVSPRKAADGTRHSVGDLGELFGIDAAGSFGEKAGGELGDPVVLFGLKAQSAKHRSAQRHQRSVTIGFEDYTDTVRKGVKGGLVGGGAMKDGVFLIAFGKEGVDIFGRKGGRLLFFGDHHHSGGVFGLEVAGRDLLDILGLNAGDTAIKVFFKSQITCKQLIKAERASDTLYRFALVDRAAFDDCTGFFDFGLRGWRMLQAHDLFDQRGGGFALFSGWKRGSCKKEADIFGAVCVSPCAVDNLLFAQEFTIEAAAFALPENDREHLHRVKVGVTEGRAMKAELDVAFLGVFLHQRKAGLCLGRLIGALAWVGLALHLAKQRLHKGLGFVHFEVPCDHEDDVVGDVPLAIEAQHLFAAKAFDRRFIPDNRASVGVFGERQRKQFLAELLGGHVLAAFDLFQDHFGLFLHLIGIERRVLKNVRQDIKAFFVKGRR